MSLNDQLAKLKQERTAKRPAEISQMMAAEQERVAALGLEDTSLQPGDKIPAFTLPNAVGKTTSSSDLLEKGALVISFYRGAWCPFCNLELHALQRALPDIEASGAQLVAISPNLPDTSLSSVEKHNLTFEVLSDIDNLLARKFGLVFSLGEPLRPIYRKIGHDIPGQNGNDTWELPVPATFVVDRDGTIVYRYVNIDYTQRAEPAAIVAALENLRQKVSG